MTFYTWFYIENLTNCKEQSRMADSSQFSPLNTQSDQLHVGPISWVSSVFIPAFIANIGKYIFLKYDRQSFRSIYSSFL